MINFTLAKYKNQSVLYIVIYKQIIIAGVSHNISKAVIYMYILYDKNIIPFILITNFYYINFS